MAHSRPFRSFPPSTVRSNSSPYTQGVSGAFALAFPSNRVAKESTSPFAVLKFDNPQSNGFPLWGASGGGFTVIMKWRNRSVMQPGYQARFWWSQGDGNFSGSEGNIGAHGYPVKGFDQLNNYGADRAGYVGGSGSGFFIHEIATNGLDVIDSVGTNWPDSSKNTGFDGTNFGAITAGVYVNPGATYIDAVRVTRASSTSKTIRRYFNLPNVNSANYIEKVITSTYGESNPPSPVVMIGDSPWGQNATYQHEKADGDLLAVKMFTPALTEVEIVSEASDFSRLVTAAGQASIWWGRNGFDTGHATHNGTVLCHFGTGRLFTILNSGSEALDQLSLVSL